METDKAPAGEGDTPDFAESARAAPPLAGEEAGTLGHGTPRKPEWSRTERLVLALRGCDTAQARSVFLMPQSDVPAGRRNPQGNDRGAMPSQPAC